MTINIKPSHKGLLHKKLGVPQGSPMPAGKVAKAAKSSNPTLKKEAVFAENAKKWNHGGGHKPQVKTPVKSDRGTFSIKG